MIRIKNKVFILIVTILLCSGSCVAQNSDSIVVLETNYGVIKVRLYNETVKHRENFLKLVNSGFYNGVLFHRVINGFMIQAGDPKSKNAKPEASLGDGDVGYTLPAEFIYPKYYHKRGVLAAAREGDDVNPKKSSSGCQFYIVQGRVFTDDELAELQNKREQSAEGYLFQQILKTKQNQVDRLNKEHDQYGLDRLRDKILDEVHAKMQADSSLFRYNDEQWKTYTTVGGTPHLDGNYTVFGEVVEGMEVVDKIAAVSTGKADRPVADVKIIKAELQK